MFLRKSFSSTNTSNQLQSSNSSCYCFVYDFWIFKLWTHLKKLCKSTDYRVNVVDLEKNAMFWTKNPLIDICFDFCQLIDFTLLMRMFVDTVIIIFTRKNQFVIYVGKRWKSFLRWLNLPISCSKIRFDRYRVHFLQWNSHQFCFRWPMKEKRGLVLTKNKS